MSLLVSVAIGGVGCQEANCYQPLTCNPHSDMIWFIGWGVRRGVVINKKHCNPHYDMVSVVVYGVGCQPASCYQRLRCNPHSDMVSVVWSGVSSD